MKKFLSLMLVLICALSLFGCNNKSMNDIIQNEPKMIGIVKKTNENAITHGENDTIVSEEDEEDSEECTQSEQNFINPTGMTVESRIEVPNGYTRTETESRTFQEFLRNYPVKEDNSPVLLYNGRKKGNQSAHAVVLELPLENEDLQQCADSIMRIYAEYFYQTEQYDKISFQFVNGFEASYTK